MELKNQIEMKYTPEEYAEKFAELGQQIEDSEAKHGKWLYINFNELKAIYIEKLIDNDDMVCSPLGLNWATWTRFMYNVSLYNTIRDNQFNDELNQILGNQ